ncbi:MAG TPA: phytoene desaturase [Chloroflexi bacterium]|nr:phytoene desaturase [Chloroflexota bacterium]
MGQKIIVIGSGFGGLAAAARLAAKGNDVTLYEKRDKLGGRAYTYEINGFKFDGGPTVITAPWLLDEIWTLAGRRREDYFELIPIDPFYKIFDHQGRDFSYNGDHEYILSQIEQWNPRDKEGYTRFMATTKEIFDAGMALIDKPFLHFGDMLRVAPDLVRLQSYRSVYGYVSKFIEDDFLRRCFSFHPLLIGGNPLDAPSLYVLIHYLEREWGIHYAKGGTGAIVDAFGRLLDELGVKVHLNTEIQEIVIEGKRVKGVRLADGAVHTADAVVSNADVGWTYLNMIPRQHRRKNSDRWVKSKKFSMSLFVIYFGTKKRYNTGTKLAHHNIILSERYKGLLREIFAEQDLPEDFSLYLHMPTMTDPSMAPPGHEAFYVLSPVPNLNANIDWTTKARHYRDAIMQFLEDHYLPDLQANIVAEHSIDPLHFQNTLNSYLGSAFSVEPTLLQSAWFRPHNRSEDFENLYFVGAGTHPGAGLPGVISSAKIVDDLLNPAGATAAAKAPDAMTHALQGA